MSQARTIYGYMAGTDNAAADKALLLGWTRAEEPYRTALLEVMLDRGTGTLTLELIRQYHRFSPAWQNVMCQRVDTLYGGLYLTGWDGQVQTRLNGLGIIKQTHDLRLVDLVCGLLRDRNEKVARLAGTTLLDLVRKFIRRENPPIETADKEDLELEQEKENVNRLMSEREMLKTAVKKAVHNFEVHQRPEAVLAGMCLTQADDLGFWQEKLAGYHPVGRTVRDLLLKYGWGDLAEFCLSALKVPDLRTTAVRAIAEQERGEFVGALAQRIKDEQDEIVLRSLRTITQPKWLEANLWFRWGFTEHQQLGLIDLLGYLGVSGDEKAGVLVQMAKNGAEAASLKAVTRLSEMEGDGMPKSLLELLAWDKELVALAAAWRLIKKEPAGVERIMVGQMKNRHEQVRRLAWGYYRGVAFKRFWENFDRLTPKQKIAAGRAVFKLDRQAQAKWRQKVKFGAAAERLRAVQVARVLDLPAGWPEELKKLTRDDDRKVRSCAVAGLGDARQPDRATEVLLLGALKDADSRVRANAVEALQQNGWRDAERMFELTADTDNRVRANAIRALLSVRVEAARQAVREMLHDRRARHRCSARWVLESIRRGWKADPVSQTRDKQDINYTKTQDALV